MRKAKAAVRYGMETLKLSPDELFKLIESSQGYDGEDYNRWLASKIIEVAEKDGVQYSQLLVKKFNIINEILEEVSGSQVVKDEFLDIFKGSLHKDLYSVDFEEVGNSLSDVDWYTGIDFDTENSFFVKEKLPLEVQNKVLENESFSILFKLSLDSSDKKSDLYSDAKSQGLLLHNKGSMLIYRLCSMVNAFDLSNVKFGLSLPVKFLYEEENVGIVDYMLDCFNIVEGYSMKSVEVSSNAFNAGDIAFITLVPKVDESQDGVVLTAITLDDEEVTGFVELEEKRYSKSSTPMLNKIAENSPNLTDTVPYISPDGDVGTCDGHADALGYLNINGDVSLTTLPEKVGKRAIAITENNIKDIVAYYGVTVSRELDWGYSDDIPCLIDGRVGYEELLYNCLPLFLFDYKVKFCNHEEVGVTNKLDAVDSEVIQDLLDVGTPYFSFEAKELFNLCLDYIKYTKENMGISGKSFNELRELSNNADFNRMYDSKLAILKEFVNNLSKRYL